MRAFTIFGRLWDRAWPIAVALAILAAPGTSAAQQPITVFAAASLKNALDAANVAWTEESGYPVVVSYAASAALAKQIEAGAPADVFISADLAWMEYLSEHELVDRASIANLLGNRIVLIGPAGTPPVDIVEGFRLEGMLGDGKLAMAAPDSVPAGRYAKAALEKLGVWTRVEQRIASAENVRVALQYVSRGEAPYGIVYETDARADPAVAVLGIFPEGSHPQIIYPAAVLAASVNSAAAPYLEYLTSPAARPYFENEGFKVLAEDE